MTKFLLPIIILGATILSSCNGETTDRKHTSNPVTPEALQDNQNEISSYSKRGKENLLEDLYQELVSKSPELKKLEEDLEAFNVQKRDTISKYENYNNKSNSYYTSAHSEALSITDSLLKNKILSLITQRKIQYNNKISNLNTLLIDISKNDATVNDFHSVLKITLTLPLIEKYQDDYLPNVRPFQDLIKEQNKLIERTNKLTPQY